MDFGGLKEFKQWAEYMFDHTLLVAEDDPELQLFLNMPKHVADLRVVSAVGCERFAEMAYNKMSELLDKSEKAGTLLNPTVCIKSVEVFEHGANSAIYEG
jgi:6-pyruvoyltetrahydropterin/6-carboxytetrahydropterin synthase